MIREAAAKTPGRGTGRGAVYGWIAPANLPPDIVRKLTDELIAVGKLPEVRTAFEKFGVLQTELPGPAYAEALRKERAAYARVAEKAGIKLP